MTVNVTRHRSYLLRPREESPPHFPLLSLSQTPNSPTASAREEYCDLNPFTQQARKSERNPTERERGQGSQLPVFSLPENLLRHSRLSEATLALLYVDSHCLGVTLFSFTSLTIPNINPRLPLCSRICLSRLVLNLVSLYSPYPFVIRERTLKDTIPPHRSRFLISSILPFQSVLLNSYIFDYGCRNKVVRFVGHKARRFTR